MRYLPSCLFTVVRHEPSPQAASNGLKLRLTRLTASLLCVLAMGGCDPALAADPLRPQNGKIGVGDVQYYAQSHAEHALASSNQLELSGFAGMRHRKTTCENEGLSALTTDKDAIWLKLSVDADTATLHVGGWAAMTGKAGKAGSAQTVVTGRMMIQPTPDGPQRQCDAKGQYRAAPGEVHITIHERLSDSNSGSNECETTLEAVLIL